MKIKKNIIIGLLFLILLNACSLDNQSCMYQINYMPFTDNDSDEYGFISENGKFLPQKFVQELTPVVNGYFAIRGNEGYLLCKVDGDTYEKIDYGSRYAEVGVMNDGLLPVCKHNDYVRVLDMAGNERFTLAQVDSVEVRECFSYSCGKMRVLLVNGMYVFVDKEGKNALGGMFDWANDFVDGYAIVGTGDDKYQLITTEGKSVLSFICDDPDEIVVSTKYKKLAAKSQDDSYTIYGFDGQYVNLPKMVEGVYALLQNEFIFKANYDYGLMTYDDCRDKIYAKYKQLVPNGRYYLGIPSDNNEVVKLLDSNGIELNTFDGDEIISPRSVGFNFPNIIKRPDDRSFLIDSRGKIIGRAENIEFDNDDIEYAAWVHNCYFPQQQVDSVLLRLCGHGIGAPTEEGVFFCNNGLHCHLNDINYFRNSNDLERFKGKFHDKHVIESGVNYSISMSYKFDEPIVRMSSKLLNASAWLEYAEIEFDSNNRSYVYTTYEQIKKHLQENGCSELFSNANGSVFRGYNNDNLLVLLRESRHLTIRMSYYSDSSANSWTIYLKNKK